MDRLLLLTVRSFFKTHVLPLLEMEAEQKSQSARKAGILVAILMEAMRERGATSKTSKYQLDGTLKKNHSNY